MRIQDEIYDFLQIKNMIYSTQDSDDIYSILIDLGKLIHSIDKKYKIDQNKVYGCQSNVWIIIDNDTIYIDSDSIIVKGLLHVVLSIISLSNFDPSIDLEKYILDKIESTKLMDFISTFRKTGLMASIHKLCKLIQQNNNQNSWYDL